MSSDDARLCAIAHEFARIARAAAPRLPREVVDAAAQEAWVRWLKACSGKREEALAVRPVAFLVGIFRHVCADAVRAHRRRQLRYLLAADSGATSMEVVMDTRSGGALGMEQIIEQLVRPALAGLPQTDVDLWIAAKIEGRGWFAAGAAAGLDRSTIERTRRRTSRFLSAEGVLVWCVRQMGHYSQALPLLA